MGGYAGAEIGFDWGWEVKRLEIAFMVFGALVLAALYWWINWRLDELGAMQIPLP